MVLIKLNSMVIRKFLHWWIYWCLSFGRNNS